MTRRITAAVALCVLALAALLAGACGGGGGAAQDAAPALRDPGGPGPYAAGVTNMTFERPSSADGSPRRLDTMFWYPADGGGGDGARRDAPAAATGGPFPVVVFSHGSGGQPRAYTFFAEHLASWGYVVVAPPHPGNTSEDCTVCDSANLVASARERPGDMTAALDGVLALRDDPLQPLGKVVDPARTAIAGHSFGGWTAVFVAPGGRFNAAIALAPGLPATLLARAESVRVPVLLIAGGKDQIVPEGSVRKLFDALPATIDKRYVLLPAGTHLSFVETCFGCDDALSEERGHESTNRYATAFLQVHLAGDARYAQYLDRPDPPDAVLVAPSN